MGPSKKATDKTTAELLNEPAKDTAKGAPLLEGDVPASTDEDLQPTPEEDAASLEEAESQFPDKPELEVEKRSVDGSHGTTFRKVFRVLIDEPNLSEDEHNRNKDGVLREAINRGLHPKEEVEYVGVELYEQYRDSKTYDFAYEVKVEPASRDEEPGETVTPSTNPSKPTPSEADGPDVVRRDPKALQDPAVTDPDPTVDKDAHYTKVDPETGQPAESTPKSRTAAAKGTDKNTKEA